MEELDLTRWVIVMSNHGEKYVGQVPVVNNQSPYQYFMNATKNHEPVTLHNARLMLAQYGAPQGNLAAGIQCMVAFIPIDMNDGPIEEIHIVPSSWYFPETVPGVVDKFSRLLAAAEDSETRNRARQSGIATPGD